MSHKGAERAATSFHRQFVRHEATIRQHKGRTSPTRSQHPEICTVSKVPGEITAFAILIVSKQCDEVSRWASVEEGCARCARLCAVLAPGATGAWQARAANRCAAQGHPPADRPEPQAEMTLAPVGFEMLLRTVNVGCKPLVPWHHPTQASASAAGSWGKSVGQPRGCRRRTAKAAQETSRLQLAGRWQREGMGWGGATAAEERASLQGAALEQARQARTALAHVLRAGQGSTMQLPSPPRRGWWVAFK